MPEPIPLGQLFDATTRRLLTKEWRQLRASGSAFWTSLLLPAFMLLVLPQTMILAIGTASDEALTPNGSPPSFGALAEIGDDPTRTVLALLPMLVVIAALAAPTALITHAIVHERETRTLELLIALPVRIQQVVAAKLTCAFAFTAAVCGICLLVVNVELLALGLASIGEALALFALLLAALAQATATALLVAVLAKDFRTANNLAGVMIVPAILAVIAVSLVVSGAAARSLLLALLFTVGALAIARVALRSATFEKLLA